MKCIILELIPTSLNPDFGDIIQLSALKIDDLKLVVEYEIDNLQFKVIRPDKICIAEDCEEYKV